MFPLTTLDLKIKGGGVSIFVTKELDFKLRSDLAVISKNIECVFIELNKLDICLDKNVIIGAVYRPPSSSIANFIVELEVLLHIISSKNTRTYWVITILILSKLIIISRMTF